MKENKMKLDLNNFDHLMDEVREPQSLGERMS